MKTLIDENTELLNSLKACDGDMARLAHRLSETTERLRAVLDQANAQFRAGDRHATFNRQTIESLNLSLR